MACVENARGYDCSSAPCGRCRLVEPSRGLCRARPELLPPGLFLLGFSVAAAYWPGTLEGAFAARWILMAVLACLLLLLCAEETPMPLGGLGALLLIGLGASTWWAPDPLAGAEQAQTVLILGVVFCLGSISRDLGPAWTGLAAGIAVSAALALGQQFLGWDLVSQTAAPGGLFVNRNILAEAGVVALIPMLIRRNWWLAVPCALAVVLGGSRGAFGALAVVGALWPTDNKATQAWGRLALGVAIIAGLAGLLWTESGEVRIGFWAAALSDLTLGGHGFGSFVTAYPFAEYAHSEYVQAVYELGVFAIAPAALVIYLLRGHWLNDESGLILTAVLALAVLSFPFHMPVTGFAAALAAGRLAGARALVRGIDRRLRDLHGARDGRAGSGPGRVDVADRPGRNLESDLAAHSTTGRGTA